MIIGILTYHSVANFGANLQALSTVEYLKKTGHTPVVINWLPEDLEEQYRKSVPDCQYQVHLEFVKKYLPISKLCRSDKDILQIIKDESIEKIIIGSDAVLKHETFFSRIYFPTKKLFFIAEEHTDTSFPNPFWGSFSDGNIPVAMMSASCQNADFKYIWGPKKSKMKKSLQRFSYISVRDFWTQKMVKYLTDNLIVPEITPDPVFSFNQNVRFVPEKKELLHRYGLPDKYILISFKNNSDVSVEWLEEFNSIMKQKGILCVAMAMPNGLKINTSFMHSIDIPLPPLDWYALIKYSQGYVGHNMHPIIVAIHNNVPFYCFDYYGIVKFKFFVNEKSSKIYDLLIRSGLYNNRISTVKNMSTITPEFVAERLFLFDYKKCDAFRNIMYSQYLKMMDDIISVFSK